MKLTSDDPGQLKEVVGAVLISIGIVTIWAGVMLGMFVLFEVTR